MDENYLLISEDGENLRTRNTPIAFKAKGKFWVNNHAHILAEKEEGILDYLEYYFSKLDINPYITGAVQPKLNKANLDSIGLPIPPKEERLVINKVLNSFTHKIEVNNKANQTLETIAQALFKSWFVDFDPVKAKLSVLAAGGSAEEAERAAMCAISARDEASLNTLQTEQPEAYAELARTAALFPSAMQDSELGEIPVGWNISRLQDCCIRVEAGGTPKRSEALYWGGNIKWLSSGEVRNPIVPLCQHSCRLS
ncbi:restriction endonuclease subunit S [Endozoicomonas sp. SCSIO W0465]|uniref:restriction endonuclease subunit S n=1 Tax=Endozoicomonas sp. SCSIO W0465 TaxID=2918516 RepID=UPI002074E7CB|nr:restriction endonuclease subunit S [Endozoicomonas sp. SCSIO W0465]USE36594.1 restriction endonuclease subunit S [Endozoicomonas sp. SCSIO W0465]